jgi:hypothetical protein
VLHGAKLEQFQLAKTVSVIGMIQPNDVLILEMVLKTKLIETGMLLTAYTIHVLKYLDMNPIFLL